MSLRIVFLVLASVMCTALVMPTASAAVGFEAGNEFTVQPYLGQFKLYCVWGGGTPKQIMVNCYKEKFESTTKTRFVTEHNVDADFVTLANVHPDKTSVLLSSKFNSKRRRSNGKFELWNEYNGKKLLERGRNQVGYKLIKDGQAVEHGVFDVYVESLQSKHCYFRQFLVEKPHCYSQQAAQQYCVNYFTGNICI